VQRVSATDVGWNAIVGALTSARSYRCATPHPASPKLGFASLRLRILLPQGEKGVLCGSDLKKQNGAILVDRAAFKNP
jgi:hypothetical protein